MKKKSYLMRAIIFAAALVLFLIATNPAILFFLPAAWKAELSKAWGSAFGDVGSIADTVTFNWISVFKIIAIVLILLILDNLIRFVLSKIKPKTGKGRSLVSMVSSFSTYAIVLIGIIWCLSAVGVNLSTIFASIGIVALVIGFAAESLIADVITGVFLVFEDEFNIGDIIEFNGFRGTVTAIGIRVTCIQDNGGNVKIVNNSDIRDVLNRSKASSKAVCDIPVSYEQDLATTEQELLKILQETATRYPDVFTTPPQYLGVQELATSGMNLRVVADVNEADIFRAARIINREVKLGFDKAGIEIPFTQVVVHKAD